MFSRSCKMGTVIVPSQRWGSNAHGACGMPKVTQLPKFEPGFLWSQASCALSPTWLLWAEPKLLSGNTHSGLSLCTTPELFGHEIFFAEVPKARARVRWFWLPLHPVHLMCLSPCLPPVTLLHAALLSRKWGDWEPTSGDLEIRAPNECLVQKPGGLTKCSVWGCQRTRPVPIRSP